MAHVAVTAVGDDQPGIVAAVTDVLVGQGCNLEDTSMSILRGHFAMMLIVACPAGLDAPSLEQAIASATTALGLTVTVRPVSDEAPVGNGSGDAWTVVVYGTDRPGIVHRMSAELADLGVNIVDLTTRVSGGDGAPVYSMVLEIVVPSGVNSDEVAERLHAAATSLGVECTLHRSEADIL